MKKIISAVLAALLWLPLSAQDILFPFSQYVSKTPEELKAEKFRYNYNHNQYTRKKSGRVKEGLILAAFGMYEEYIPGNDDYRLYIKCGKNQLIASVNVEFYIQRLYDRLYEMATEESTHYYIDEFPEGFTVHFVYKGFHCSLTNNFKTVYRDGYSENYSRYHYTIRTGIEEDSPWQRKLNGKLERREQRRIKKDIRREKRANQNH